MPIRIGRSPWTPVEVLADEVVHVADNDGNVSCFLQSRYPRELKRIFDIVRWEAPVQWWIRRRIIEILFAEKDSWILQPYLQKSETIDSVSPDVIEMLHVTFIEKYLCAVWGKKPPTTDELTELHNLYLEGNIRSWLTLESLSSLIWEYYKDDSLNIEALFSCIRYYWEHGSDYIMELRDETERIRQQEEKRNNPIAEVNIL